MFGIGDFARLGRVSIRMLRHYDALGLLLPAQVDPVTGYRRYRADQLGRLNRIIALKDLGFTLQQVHSIIDERLELAQLQGMLRLRRAELEAALAADRSRLASVEARLTMIEAEGTLPDTEVVVRTIPAVRVAQLWAMADSYAPDDIGPVIQPLFMRLCERFDDAGVVNTEPGIAYYEAIEDGVRVHAAFALPSDRTTVAGCESVTLPAIAAATVVHHGSMELIEALGQELADWIERHGYRSTGLAREISLECPPDPRQWVTELQEPITRLD